MDRDKIAFTVGNQLTFGGWATVKFSVQYGISIQRSRWTRGILLQAGLFSCDFVVPRVSRLYIIGQGSET
jgi:hypothetical protein